MSCFSHSRGSMTDQSRLRCQPHPFRCKWKGHTPWIIIAETDAADLTKNTVLKPKRFLRQTSAHALLINLLKSFFFSPQELNCLPVRTVNPSMCGMCTPDDLWSSRRPADFSCLIHMEASHDTHKEESLWAKKKHFETNYSQLSCLVELLLLQKISTVVQEGPQEVRWKNAPTEVWICSFVCKITAYKAKMRSCDPMVSVWL